MEKDEKERKKKLSFPSVPTQREIENSKKIAKKLKKVKKYHYGFTSSQESVGKGGERDKIKVIITFRSHPTRNLKFQKNCNKIKKIKVYHYGFVSKENWLEKAGKEKK